MVRTGVQRGQRARDTRLFTTPIPVVVLQKWAPFLAPLALRRSFDFMSPRLNGLASDIVEQARRSEWLAGSSLDSMML